MQHPARSDFASVVTEAGVSVTFKPTNSVYTFYRLAAGEDVARLSPVAFAGVQHAGATPKTILPMRFKPWRSALLRNSVRPFGQFKRRKKPISERCAVTRLAATTT